MFDKLKLKAAGKDIQTAGEPVGAGESPSSRAILQNRRSFGVNLGSWFVLEKYIFGDLFVDDTKAELECVRAQVRKNGLDATRSAFEAHWSSYITDDDWQYLQDHRVNSVRLPVGYWHLGARFTAGTPFEEVAGVYANAWSQVRGAVEAAAARGISVVLDLHAVPLGANTGDHSGQELRSAGFWSSSKAIALAVECCAFLAGEAKAWDNVCGIQIVNEAEYSGDRKSQRLYYAAAINAIRTLNPTIPIIISDGWDPAGWAEWARDKSVVLDCHIYRCFSDADKAKAPEQIIEALKDDCLGPEADIIVGEYSCVLDGASWSKTGGDRDNLVQRYGNEQHRLFNERANAGSYFWTYRFQYGDGGEWGFRPMVDRGCLPLPPTANLPDGQAFTAAVEEHYGAHCLYWDSQDSHGTFDHERYREGFTLAWNDSLEFALKDASRIGRVWAWTACRRMQHIKARGESPFVWEWEQGFSKGLQVFAEICFSG